MAKNHNKYRKDKPWDNEEIDHWKIDEFKPEEVTGTFLEESSFATLFPKYREKYLREVWPVVTRTLEVCHSDIPIFSALMLILFFTFCRNLVLRVS